MKVIETKKRVQLSLNYTNQGVDLLLALDKTNGSLIDALITMSENLQESLVVLRVLAHQLQRSGTSLGHDEVFITSDCSAIQMILPQSVADSLIEHSLVIEDPTPIVDDQENDECPF
ncbi:hypothetical protein RCL1_007394 [Eukaryota sp. TZLM3-RCL]